MVGKDLILAFSDYDLNRVIADQEEIRRCNPQRFEMEQLTAIVYEDLEQHICAAYKDVTEREFWIRGHMPGRPLMPGVLMCEAAAQLTSFYAIRRDLTGPHTLGFAGLDKVRFRDIVRPGDRLVIVVKLLKIRREVLIASRFQAFVERSLVCEGNIKGIVLPLEEEGPTEQLAGRPDRRVQSTG